MDNKQEESPLLFVCQFIKEDVMVLKEKFQLFNVVSFVGFIIIFFIGASETGYQNVGDNLPWFVLMLFGALGILIQFTLLNIYIYKRIYN